MKRHHWERVEGHALLFRCTNAGCLVQKREVPRKLGPGIDYTEYFWEGCARVTSIAPPCPTPEATT